MMTQDDKLPDHIKETLTKLAIQFLNREKEVRKRLEEWLKITEPKKP